MFLQKIEAQIQYSTALVLIDKYQQVSQNLQKLEAQRLQGTMISQSQYNEIAQKKQYALINMCRILPLSIHLEIETITNQEQ